MTASITCFVTASNNRRFASSDGPTRPSHYFADILDTIADVEKLTAGKTLATYSNDLATKRAVERSIEIISEAARGIPANLTKTGPKSPGSRSAASAMCSAMSTIGLWTA